MSTGTPRTHSSVAGAIARRAARTSPRLLFLLAVLFTTTTSWAQGGFIQGQVITSTGKPAAFATVRVCPYTGAGNPCTPLSSLFSDPALTQGLPNPYTTDSFGNFSVAVTGGYYIVQIVPTPGTTFSYIYSVPPGGGVSGLTSVGLSMPNIFSVANSPLTANGTLAVTLATQTANKVFASPVSGSAAAPTFRALVAADIPSLSYVTSVGLTAPSSVFTVSNTPITTSGNIALGFQNQLVHTVLAGPASGSATSPAFRQLSYADISGTPTLYYQTLNFNGTPATQAATANFSNLFTFSNGTNITNIGLSTTGSEAAVVTGSAGVTGNCMQWNGLGGAGDAGAPCGGSGGITQGTGPVTFGPGTGSVPTTITPTGVTPGVYVAGASSFTINAAGQVVSAGPPFTIASFTCTVCAGSPYETGNTVATSASGTASYANPTVPASASVSDGTNVVTLMTPFTSWTQARAYTTDTCFTLTAMGNGQTINSSPQCITFYNRSFGGTGTGGSATSATASGNNAVLVGATGTLSISYLGSSCTGQVFNVTTSGTQYVYLLLPCNVSNPSGGSFTTPGPTVFQMNTPTSISFTNQYGSVLTYYLYRSTNSFVSGTNNVITVGP